MIILEGCDGSGKTNLARRLCDDLNLPMHPRSSDSTTGPVKDLYKWAMNDVDTFYTQPLAIYDRHPFVSNYIYGPIVHHRMDPRFLAPEVQPNLRRFIRNAFIIFCDPGDDDIQNNVYNSRNQMSGVSENIGGLILAYRSYFTLYSGSWVQWDYNRPMIYDHLLDRLSIHTHNWKVPA